MQWGKGKFQSGVVRRVWNLSAGFVIWSIWKERNKRIFRDKSCQTTRIWEEICRSIKETILSETWEEEDWKLNQEEWRIISKLNMEYSMVYLRAEKRIRPSTQSPKHFKYSGEHMIKLNFDGVSKGNPGQAGLGGIFRDSKENTKWVGVCGMGRRDDQ